MIVAKIGSTERYLDRGAILPEGVSADERKRLVGLGLVAIQKIEIQPDAAAEAEAKAKAEAEAKAKAEADTK